MSLAVKTARGVAQGDPGIFGDIGKFIGGAVKTVGGLLPGPIGLAAKAAGGVLQRISGGGGGGAPAQVIRPPRIPRTFGSGARGIFRPGPTAAAARQLTIGAPAGATSRQAATARAAGLACPKGMRPNKSSYHLNSGEFVLAGTKCVAIRRRNPLNPRAADRAISRLESSKLAVQKINRFSIRKKKCD